ncbi:hypothetical protein LPC08_06120 [Roseomonas sp. OT10]|uniref:hypothetical protein n=1 Tax=Roseomonas cutis TaxID=2897332 RepID=UPI001E5543D8|nr:hypothetical protein [Roseomonas sp. OT10]UFN50198.1 hypothetical protein LPC08_06120 [Roseomonas sp. OT10]
MIPVLHETERDRLLDFLRRRLIRTIPAGGGRPSLEAAGVAAEADPAWTGATAEAAALLALPEAWRRDPVRARGLLGFVLAMGEGEGILRGWAPPQRLTVRAADPRRFVIETAWARFTGDLSRGEVVETRPGPGGEAEARHTGNLVEFRARGLWHCLDVEDRIAAYGLEREGEGVVLYHESPLAVPGRWPWQREAAPVGTVRYAYHLQADRPVLRLVVTLRAAPGQTLRGARLTTAWDELGARAAYRAVAGQRDSGWERRMVTEEAGAVPLFDGPLRNLALLAEGGAAPALHARPRDPAAVLGVRGHPRPGGRLHWVVVRHAVGTVPGGGEATLTEDRLLEPAGATEPPEAAAARLEDGAPRAAEFALPAEAAAALEAVATVRLFAASGAYAAPAGLREWLDRHLAALEPRLGDAAALSRTVCALDALARADREPRDEERLAALGARLAGLAAPEPGEAAALRLLALARLGLHGVAVPGLAEQAAAGLMAWPEDMPAGMDSSLAGLLLRAVSALRLAGERGDLALPPEAVARAEALTEALLRRLQMAACDRGASGVQILAAPGTPLDARPDLLAQVRVTLGLGHPEGLLADLRPARAAPRPRGVAAG